MTLDAISTIVKDIFRETETLKPSYLTIAYAAAAYMLFRERTDNRVQRFVTKNGATYAVRFVDDGSWIEFKFPIVRIVWSSHSRKMYNIKNISQEEFESYLVIFFVFQVCHMLVDLFH